MNIIIINIYQMPQSACYFRNNSLRNYKLTLVGLKASCFNRYFLTLVANKKLAL